MNAFNIGDPDALQAAPEVDISVLYFYDADDKGVAYRLENLSEELKEVFYLQNLPGEILNNELLEIEDMKFGAHVFTEQGTDKGMLEDVLLPLIEEDNEDILDAARNFLAIHSTTRLFSEKLTYDANGALKKVNGQKYSEKKSLVGTVGQLQKSGKSNTVCIRDADYLNDNKIKGSAACTNILKFINKAVK